MNKRPLKMSLNYQKLVDYYEGLVAQGVELQANERQHLAECRRFLATELLSRS